MSDRTEIHVKDINKDTATRNLHIKLNILNHFVNHGIPWQLDDNGDFLRIPDTGVKILDSFEWTL
jgi:hypothetical protein